MNSPFPSLQNPYFYFPPPYNQFPTYPYNPFMPIILQQNVNHTPDTVKVMEGTGNKESPELKEPPKKAKNTKKVKDSEYEPTEDKMEKAGKRYKKDQNRNIIPNTINQIFSFLEKKFKSELKLKRVLELYKLEKYCSVPKFYIYHKILKSKLNNYLTQASLEKLFEIVDPAEEIFTVQEQLVFIKINGILLHHYLRGSESPCRLLCTQKARTDKKPAYLNANRRIEEMLNSHIEEFQKKYDYDFLK